MAEYGEWNRKGATLSDKTAKKEFSIDQEFIVRGIKSGKLEYKEASVWGNPFLRLLRGQLEQYVTEELGADHLLVGQKKTRLRKIKSEITKIKKKLKVLQTEKSYIEKQINNNNLP